jgi:hypothetical protein
VSGENRSGTADRIAIDNAKISGRSLRLTVTRTGVVYTRKGTVTATRLARNSLTWFRVCPQLPLGDSAGPGHHSGFLDLGSRVSRGLGPRRMPAYSPQSRFLLRGSALLIVVLVLG